MTVNVSNSKFLVVVQEMQDMEMSSMRVDGGSFECVKKFQYLGSIIAADGQINVELDAYASRAFGALWRLFSTIPTFFLPLRGRYTELMFSPQCCSMEVSV